MGPKTMRLNERTLLYLLSHHHHHYHHLLLSTARRKFSLKSIAIGRGQRVGAISSCARYRNSLYNVTLKQ